MSQEIIENICNAIYIHEIEREEAWLLESLFTSTAASNFITGLFFSIFATIFPHIFSFLTRVFADASLSPIAAVC